MKSTHFVYHRVSMIKTELVVGGVPLLQSHPSCVVNCVEYRDGLLVAEISLSVDVSMKVNRAETGHARNMSMAICLLLSWKLLIYALDTLFVASERTPS
jgi:hypothetical protein